VRRLLLCCCHAWKMHTHVLTLLSPAVAGGLDATAPGRHVRPRGGGAHAAGARRERAHKRPGACVRACVLACLDLSRCCARVCARVLLRTRAVTAAGSVRSAACRRGLCRVLTSLAPVVIRTRVLLAVRPRSVAAPRCSWPRTSPRARCCAPPPPRRRGRGASAGCRASYRRTSERSTSRCRCCCERQEAEARWTVLFGAGACCSACATCGRRRHTPRGSSSRTT
jgi:hypothetical protein